MGFQKGKQEYVVGVVGATGMVGRKVMQILEEREFPAGELRLFASERSAGKTVSFGDREIEVALLDGSKFAGCDIVFFCAGGPVSTTFVPMAAGAGAVVIDKSSVFRMQEDVPLVVPEVNVEDLAAVPRNIVASPNCSTIPLVMVLKPLLRHVPLRRVIVSTYQSVSGAGMGGVEEMMEQARAQLAGEEIPEPAVFPRKIAFNLFPHIDAFGQDGYTREERKLIDETRKILHLPDLPVTCTAVRVPVTVSHGESVTIDFERPLEPPAVREILSAAPGIIVMDDPGKAVYPVPEDARDGDEVLVGRIREDSSKKGSINLWLVADNVRKGAATNAVQIAESICQ